MSNIDSKDYIYGKNAILECLHTSIPISDIMLKNNLDKDNRIEEIVRLAKARNINIKYADISLFKKLGFLDKSQGICAKIEKYNYYDFSSIIDKNQKDPSLVIICDHITDCGNFGAIIRSAECVGATCIVIPNSRSISINASVYKTSVGAVSHIPICQVPNIRRIIKELKDKNYWIAGATEHSDRSVFETSLVGNIALLLGNEEKGISKKNLGICDMLVSLPQYGKISSLNVAQAATAIMYEWVRQNEFN